MYLKLTAQETAQHSRTMDTSYPDSVASYNTYNTYNVTL